jgi:hypothetical protein
MSKHITNWLIKLLGGLTWQEFEEFDERYTQEIDIHVEHLLQTRRNLRIVCNAYKGWAASKLPHERKAARAMLSKAVADALQQM